MVDVKERSDDYGREAFNNRWTFTRLVLCLVVSLNSSSTLTYLYASIWTCIQFILLLSCLVLLHAHATYINVLSSLVAIH